MLKLKSNKALCVTLCLATTLLLVSCKTVNSDGFETKSLILPDKIVYTSEQQAALATELTTNDVPMCVLFVKDYHVTQQQIEIARRALLDN